MVQLTPSDDIDRIMAVMQTAFDPAYGEAWTRAQLDNTLVLGHCSYRLIGADGELPGEAPAAGFTLCRTILDEEELLLFAVAPEWRGRGLGKMLLRQLIDSAPSRGVKRIFLEMRDNNPADRCIDAPALRRSVVGPTIIASAAAKRLTPSPSRLT
jgi:ribosomal-protein-alanine N-acetyltransferase